MTALAPLVQAFFTHRLTQQRDASPNTVAAYRDTFRLLLRYINDRNGKPPSKLALEDLDAAVITAFLKHLETTRGNKVRTVNARLGAIHSFFRYAALQAPENAELIQRVLTIPERRFETAVVSYLTRFEIDALLDSPDRTTWTGRRDHALLLLAVQTGLRVSELAGLRCQDIHLGAGAYVECIGKGRKQRRTPLSRPTPTILGGWLRERRGEPGSPLFPSRAGRPLTRGAIWRLVTKHADTATERCPSLATKHVTPHVLRHSAAMTLLHARVDVSVIALWLGHESLESPNIYIHADMALKDERSSESHRPTPRKAATPPPTIYSTSSTASNRPGLCRLIEPVLPLTHEAINATRHNPPRDIVRLMLLST